MTNIRTTFESEMLMRGYTKAELGRRDCGRYCLASMNERYDGFQLGRETLDSAFPTESASVYGIQSDIAKPEKVREFLRAQGVRA